MKTAALTIALLMSGAAIAQTTTYTTTTTTQPDVDVDADVGIQPDGDLDVDADVDVDKEVVTTTTATTVHDTMDHSTKVVMKPSGDAVVEPSNADPERDARGIVVLSDAAIVPAGWNGVTGTAMGGPLVDPVTGETISTVEKYPACTAKITDNCLQTYEVGID